MAMDGIDAITMKGIDRVSDFQVGFYVRATLKDGKGSPLFCGWIKDRIARPNLSIAVAKEGAIIVGYRRVGIIWVVKMGDEFSLPPDVLTGAVVFRPNPKVAVFNLRKGQRAIRSLLRLDCSARVGRF